MTLKMTKPHYYISTDVEADGPIPGQNSMLSLGSVAFTPGGRVKDTFQINLQTLPEAEPDPKTMKWWRQYPEAWSAIRADPREARESMEIYHRWLNGLQGKKIFLGYPASYDFMFVYWYLMRFVGHSPFSFSALDIKTLAAERMGVPYFEAAKRNMPKYWFDGCPKHTHTPVDDAMGQGILYFNIAKDDK